MSLVRNVGASYYLTVLVFQGARKKKTLKTTEIVLLIITYD